MLADSPVTATVEIAEAKGSVFGNKPRPSASSVVVDFAEPRPSQAGMGTSLPSSRPMSRQSSRTSRTGKPEQAVEIVLQPLQKQGKEPTMGITPLVGGETTGTLHTEDRKTSIWQPALSCSGDQASLLIYSKLEGFMNLICTRCLTGRLKLLQDFSKIRLCVLLHMCCL